MVPLRAKRSMAGPNATSSGFSQRQLGTVHTSLLKRPCIRRIGHTYLLQTLARTQPEQYRSKKIYGSIVGMETWTVAYVSTRVCECMRTRSVRDGMFALPPLDTRNDHIKIAAACVLFHGGFKRRSDWRLNHPLATYSLVTSEETART